MEGGNWKEEAAWGLGVKFNPTWHPTHTHAYFWNARTLGAAYVQKAPDPKWGRSSSQGRWWLSSQCSFLGAFCNLGKSLCCWKVLSHLPFP